MLLTEASNCKCPHRICKITKENTVHAAKIFGGDNINNYIDGINPPVPRIDAHRPKRVYKSKLVGHKRNSKYCVGQIDTRTDNNKCFVRPGHQSFHQTGN